MSADAPLRTIEKLQFSLPAVFTIGPLNEPAALKQYALLLTGNADGSPSKKVMTQTGRSHVQDIVKGERSTRNSILTVAQADEEIGIIEGETRVIVSGMTMEEIFKERQIFKQKVIDSVQSELDQFGLKM